MSTLVVIDDDHAVLNVFRRILQDDTLKVLTATSGEEGLSLVAKSEPDVVVVDVLLPDESGLETFERIHRCDPRVPILVISASNDSDTVIEAMKLGAFDYLVKPLDFARVRDLVDKALAIRRLMRVPVKLPNGSDDPSDSSDMLVGNCPEMQEVYKAVGRVAAQNTTVLVRGESGTGKELVARAIYQHSLRKEGKFLAVNCAAIPEALLESELFGHEKGAFTGADSRKIGKFEQCSGGTVFLDEVGDMTPLSQSKVLRVLQDQRFERVGGHETIQTDVRIIAATNRDLEQMVADGQFRTDLYYRLKGFTINLPPLRTRGEDIMKLVQHYLRRFQRELGKAVVDVSPEAQVILRHYSWPGNVRQLESVLRQAILQATGPVLVPDFLPDEVHESTQPDPTSTAAAKPTSSIESFINLELKNGSNSLYGDALAELERLLVTRVLQQTGGNQSQAAKILGVTRGFLRKKVHQFHVSIDPVVSVDEVAEEEEEHRLAGTSP
jgi:two-component system nitrogen regulation response regulator GlnG